MYIYINMYIYVYVYIYIYIYIFLFLWNANVFARKFKQTSLVKVIMLKNQFMSARARKF